MVFIASLAFAQETLYTEGFEGTFPTWTEVVASTNGTAITWSQIASGGHVTCTPHGGSQMAMLNAWSTSNGSEARIQLPAYNFATNNVALPQFHLWMVHNSGYNSDTAEGVQLQVSTDGGTTWTNVGDFVSRPDAAATTPYWAEHVFDLSAFTSQNNVMFGVLGHSMYGTDIYIDDLSITGITNPGTIAGTVTLQGGTGNVTEALIQTGAYSTHPQANGAYTMPIAAGTYTVTCSLFGYANATQNVTITAGQTATANFTLVANANVSVSGHVVGSDQPTIGLSGAVITLHGISDYTGTTNASGDFTIPGVWANNTFAMHVEYEGYEDYDGTIATVNSNLNVGTVTLNEMTAKPRNVTATQSNDATSVALAWNSPDYSGSYFFDFEADNGGFVSNDAAGWQWGAETSQGVFSGTNCWSTVLNGNYINSASWTLDTPVLTIPSEAVLTMEHNINCESSWDGGNVSISTDGGTTWTVLAPTGGYPDDAISGLGGEPGFTASSNGYVLSSFDLATYATMNAIIRFHFGSDGSVNSYQGWSIDDVYVGPVQDRHSRIALGYNVYRMLLGQEETPETWTTLATLVTDTTYVDTAWNTMESGLYEYAVRTAYVNNVESDPAFSNWVGRNYYTSVTVNLSAVSGDNVDGAVVRLFCQDADPDGNFNEYEGTIVGGTCTFPLVWKGTYNVRVALEGFQTIEEDGISIQTPTVLTYSFTEVTNPVSGLKAQVVANDVTLDWNYPSGETVYDFEENNGEWISSSASGWMWGADTEHGANTGTNSWVTCLNANYPSSANYTLISPVVSVGGDMFLTLWHRDKTERSFDGANVKVSADNGATWTLITPIEGYDIAAISTSNAAIPGEAAFTSTSSGTLEAWQLATFDMAAFDGMDIMIKITFGSDSSVQYSGIAIDDVRLGPAEDRTRSAVRDTHVSRELVGYDIYRALGTGDYVQIQNNVDPMTLTYVDSDLADGDYTYKVVAEYTTGSSEPRFVSCQVYPLNISGYVTLSDAPTVGVTGALVEVQNDTYYFSTTTTSGAFTLTDVNGMQTYDINISYPGFTAFNTEQAVTSTDVTLSTSAAPIILVEMLIPPATATALEAGNGSSVTITWTAPNPNAGLDAQDFEGGETPEGWSITGVCTDETPPTPSYWTVNDYVGSSFAPTGTYHCGLWWSNDTQDEWLVTPQFFCPGGMLTFDAAMYIGSTYGDEFSVNISSDGENWTQIWDACDQAPEGWNYYQTPISIDMSEHAGESMYLGFRAYDGGSGAGIGYIWFLDNIALSDGRNTVSFTSDDFTSKSVAKDTYPIGYKGLVTTSHPTYADASTISRSVSVFHVQKTRSSAREDQISKNGDLTVQNTRGDLARTRETQREQLPMDRALTGYKVYRLTEGNENNQNTWTLLTTVSGTTMTYVDNAWDPLPAAVYRWAVKATYTGNYESAPKLTNAIPHDMVALVTLNVTTNTGETPQGTVVELTNHDGDAEHAYQVTIPSNAPITVEVWKGLYTITASLDMYDDWSDTSVNANEDITVNIGLIETLANVYQLTAEENQNTGDVMLTWINPTEGSPTEFRYDDGTATAQLGFSSGDNNIMGQSYTRNATLNSISWYLMDTTEATTLNFFVLGLTTDGIPDPTNILFQESDVAVSSLEWCTLDIGEVVCSNGFFVGINAPATFLALGTDDGVGDPYPFIPGTQWGCYDMNDTTGEYPFTDIADWDFEVNFLLRANGLDMGPARHDVASARTRESSRESLDSRELIGFRVKCDGTVIAEDLQESSYLASFPGHGNHTYAVAAHYTSGFSPDVEVDVFVQHVGNDDNNNAPIVTALNGNVPNPFNPDTTIRFSLANAQNVAIDIYNARGQKVTSLVNETMTAGNHSVVWRGIDDHGRSVSSGVYYYKMKSGTFTCTKKMIMLK
jgi:hypothetical protein